MPGIVDRSVRAGRAARPRRRSPPPRPPRGRPTATPGHVGATREVAGRPVASDALDDGAGPEPATTAHRDQAFCPVGAFELVEGLGQQDGAGAAERVTERDGATVGVDGVHVGVVLLGPRQDDRGERFVDLGHVDVRHLHAGALEQVARWRRSGR